MALPMQADIFQLLDQTHSRLERLLSALVRRGDLRFHDDVQALLSELMEAMEADLHGMVGALHLRGAENYSSAHLVQTAAFADCLGQALGFDAGTRRPMVAAGLTHDVGMYFLQQILSRQNGELTAYQKDKVLAHPEQGEALLRDAGVTDPVWLDAVRHHHERLDGTGYPDRLAGEELSPAARLVAVADVYAALVNPQVWREAVPAPMALRELVVKENGRLDSHMVAALIKRLGIYPAGSLVELSTGESGLVARAGKDAHRPVVYAVASPEGRPLESPARRDCGESDTSVTRLLRSDPVQRPHLFQQWQAVCLMRDLDE